MHTRHRTRRIAGSRRPDVAGLVAAAPILAALLLAAPEVRGQEDRAPAPAPPPPVERLERLRFDRLREALRLDQAKAAELRRVLEESRQTRRQAMARQQESVAALRRALAADPPDDEAVRRALERVESQRQTVERLRAEEDRRLDALLTPRQRGQLLLFDRQFDARLRELLERRRPPGAAPGADRPAVPSAPAFRGPGDAGAEAARLRERIDALERRLQQLEARGDG